MKTEVIVMESERGWGARVDEIKEFDNRQAAEKFVREFNAHNDQDTVPDWYMFAYINEKS